MRAAKKNGVLLAIFLLTAALGWLVGGRGRTVPAKEPGAAVVPLIRAQELRIGDHAVMGFSGDGSPGLWVHGKNGGKLEMGVHGNGFPFLLVSDAQVRNFGLGRVDGKNASPILVFRSGDIVRLVFGLDMVATGQEPFLAHWGPAGAKKMLMGAYCDDPSRVCAH